MRRRDEAMRVASTKTYRRDSGATLRKCGSYAICWRRRCVLSATVASNGCRCDGMTDEGCYVSGGSVSFLLINVLSLCSEWLRGDTFPSATRGHPLGR